MIEIALEPAPPFAFRLQIGNEVLLLLVGGDEEGVPPFALRLQIDPC